MVRFKGKKLRTVVVVMALTAKVVHAAVPLCTDPASTMLWQVEGANSKAASVHLFGSIHVGKPEFYPLPTVVDQHFKSAETLVFEVDPASMATPAAAMAIVQRGMLPATSSLDKEIDVDTMTALREVLQQLGLPEAVVGRMRPWMVTLTLTAMQVQKLGYNPEYGVESYLMQQKPATAAIAELETLDSQLTLMESLDQEGFLRYSLADFANTSEQLEEMVTAWRCADHTTLADILFSAREEAATFNDADRQILDQVMYRMFDERNFHMANRIDQFLKTGSGDYFVVVGAGHLLGDGSVVALLQEKGYKVTSVRRSD